MKINTLKSCLCTFLLVVASISTSHAFTSPNARRAYAPSSISQDLTLGSIITNKDSLDGIQRKNPVELRMSMQEESQEPQNLKKGRWKKSIRSSENMRKLWAKCRHKVSSAMFWQRQNRRNTLAAAAVFFSTVLATNRMEGNVHFPSSPQGGGTSSMAKTQTALVSSDNHQSQALQKQLSINRGGNTAISKNKQTSNQAQSSIAETIEGTTQTFREALDDLYHYMKGPKSDTLIILLATALITPLCQRIKTSPILGFLASGMLLGPNGMGLISGIHTTETLAELGIVFFLFEMGIELSLDRLKSMRRDVFGLGMSQFLGSAIAIAAVGSLFGIPANALVVLGGGLALSSSAFVLQLLKDKNALATRFGKASFGVLLFQDLAVVPLLVVTPILAGGGSGLAKAIGSAVVKAAMAFTSIFFAGHVVLNPLFKVVAGAKSQEAFLGVILLTVLSMSFMTEGLGLSNTLGAFLAGVLLSETKYRYQIEADIAPFRGILLGLFFITVGFEIDLNLIARNFPLVSSIVVGTLALKTTITTLLSLAFGLSLSTALQTGLLLSQGGEFAFVAFGLARNLGIFDPAMTKLLLTSVALTMAFTPLLADAGGKIAKKLEEKSDFTHYLGQDRDASEIAESEDFVVVVGYGTVGKSVCDLLDLKFIKYVGLEVNPNKAIQARNKGLPVFYGDIGRAEVAEAFNVGSAKAVIVCIADKAEANRAAISLRRVYPELKIFARAADADHAERLQRTLNIIAMVPVVPEDNVLLTLPFGGAVLRSLGAEPEEVNAILEIKRKEILDGKGLAEDEHQLILAQLGIISEPKKEAKIEVIEQNPNVAEVIETLTNPTKDNLPIIDADIDDVTEEKKDTPNV
uniref:RCK N-terminal domain-containing protein n=1 Tax=Eucampia antarctica TaxID=49252 RepID=A0A7S2WPP6_9STRA|mmetsp:Transcript_7693/g.7248  ORF Transcript_7693/g.7248 Transcript_7693/m.7248 type:complete len:861 (+) Transcript_7693:118-2700(+)